MLILSRQIVRTKLLYYDATQKKLKDGDFIDRLVEKVKCKSSIPKIKLEENCGSLFSVLKFLYILSNSGQWLFL